MAYTDPREEQTAPGYYEPVAPRRRAGDIMVDPAKKPTKPFAEAGKPGVNDPTGMMLLAMIMMAFMKPDSLNGDTEANLSKFLGFGNVDAMNQWRKNADGNFDAAVAGVRHDRIDRSKIAEQYAGVSRFSPTGNPILDMIGQKESRGDYNLAYGNKKVNFTGMTIDEVLDWQKQYVKAGSPSSAAGKYQIIQGTLAGLKREMKLSGDELFDEKMQDKLAMRLMEKRGYNQFVNGQMSEGRFMTNLSKEWASLPKDMSGRGFYDGDGLNKALVSGEKVRATLVAARNMENSTTDEQRTVAMGLKQKTETAAQEDNSFLENLPKKQAAIASPAPSMG